MDACFCMRAAKSQELNDKIYSIGIEFSIEVIPSCKKRIFFYQHKGNKNQFAEACAGFISINAPPRVN